MQGPIHKYKHRFVHLVVKTKIGSCDLQKVAQAICSSFLLGPHGI